MFFILSTAKMNTLLIFYMLFILDLLGDFKYLKD